MPRIDGRLWVFLIIDAGAIGLYSALSTTQGGAAVQFSKESIAFLIASMIAIVVVSAEFLIVFYYRENIRSIKQAIRRSTDLRRAMTVPTANKPKQLGEISAFSKLVVGSRFISKLTWSLASFYGKDITESGQAISPFSIASTAMVSALLSIAGLAPLAVYFGLFVSPYFFALLLIPLILFFVPKIRLMGARGERRKGVTDELPFFATYASTMQMVGLSIYNSLKDIVGIGVFKYVEKDALLVERNSMFFDKDPITAIENVGRNHPNEGMKTLLLGYTSQWRSGGDTGLYLVSKAADFFDDYKQRLQSYADMVANIGELTISIFFVLPMFVLTAAFVLAPDAFLNLAYFTLIGVPMLAVLIFGYLSSAQPRNYDAIMGDWRIAAAGSVAAFLVPFALGVSPLLSVATAIIAATVLYGTTVTRQLREIRAVEKVLPAFIRDMTEYQKMGYDLRKALVKIAHENTYNAKFDLYLKALARANELGLRLSDVKLKLRSWLANLTFFVLIRISETGGGSPAAMENLSEFVTRLNRVKSETRSQMRLYDILSIATPIGLSFAITLMILLLKSFTPQSAGLGSAFVQGTVTPGMITILDIIVVVCSLCAALLAAKAVDLTAKSTLRIAANVGLAAVFIALSNVIMTVLGPSLGMG